jgi:hypothetical protein
LRQDFWVYWASNHSDDVGSAMRNGSMVLDNVREIAAKEDPQRAAAQKRAGGEPIATIDQPGPGLFDSPLNAKIVRQRWNRLQPVYGQILRGCVQTYENLYKDTGDNADYGLDYPPLRLLAMTLWTWRIQTSYPGLNDFPYHPQRVFDPNRNQSVLATSDVAQPLLMVNAFCEGVTALSIFVLVWLWMERGPPRRKSRFSRLFFWPRRADGLLPEQDSWRSRWGDPMLLAPMAAFAICTLLRSNLSWQFPLVDSGEPSPIDDRIVSVGWWIFLILRFLSAVCLARFLPRPFRAPMCGLVAGTMAWLNPGSIMDSFGWPQWDTWLPPFFLVAAILATVDWWIAAGLLLGVGCMFKGQLLFVAPVLVFCPLLAGWPGRFFRIVTGMAAAAGMVVWPWLAPTVAAERWIYLSTSCAVFFCGIALFRGFMARQLVELFYGVRDYWRSRAGVWPVATRTAAIWGTCAALGAIVFFGLLFLFHRWSPSLAAVLGLAILLVPWFLPRRLLAGWVLFVFAAALWLAGYQFNGSWTWWKIGFVYGAQKHQVMQLGSQSLSNLSSILAERYDWSLHDPVGRLNLPFLSPENQMLDVQQFCGWLHGGALVLCTVAAAMHMRRKDPRFLIALTAPWVLFTSLLTQMTARYTVLPAVIASSLIGVSAEMSLLPFLQTVLAVVMLGNQMLLSNSNTAPISAQITQPTYPDMGWLMVLLAVVYLYIAVMPSRQKPLAIEVL